MSSRKIQNGRSAQAALPPSSSSSGSAKGGAVASLSVTVMTAYDLPAKEQPVSVTLSCLGQSVATAAPLARHKDRNSFKFPSTPLVVTSPKLETLYKSAATLTVNYRTVEKNQSASIQVNSLRICEATWLILNLSGTNTSTSPSSATSQDEEDVPPTLRLQVRLEGPYRPEIAAFITLGNAWFGVVDQTASGVTAMTQALPPLPDKKYFLVPAVPLATALVVLSPIVIGVLVVGLPFLLPILVMVLSTLVACSGFLVAIYCSTESGRSGIANLCSPLVHTILSTASGQRLVYDTGPRPTPVSVVRIVLPKDLMSKLFISLLIDLIGSSSYLLPGVGELLDVGWAPAQTILLMAMYEHVTPQLKYLSFAEELLPFTDVIPSATIGWLCEFGPQVLAGSAKQATTSSRVNGNATAAVLMRAGQ